jgi:branched-chain amino acid transport system ATP-binding protein
MLETRAARVAYGAAPALWDVSLHVAPGELVVVVGPNGAGKSTLINTMGGLHRLAAGALLIDHQDISRLPPHRFCDKGIAIVPEGRRLFTGLSVQENLELGSFRHQARQARVETMEEVCTLFPMLRERLKVPAGALSGGQQQMVAIARGLMARPRFLLLDEPSLGLSPLIVQDVFLAVREVNARGVAVLLVEQNVATALRIAQRAYVLDEGRIVAEGPPETLLAQDHIRRAYLGGVAA